MVVDIPSEPMDDRFLGFLFFEAFGFSLFFSAITERVEGKRRVKWPHSKPLVKRFIWLLLRRSLLLLSFSVLNEIHFLFLFYSFNTHGHGHGHGHGYGY